MKTPTSILTTLAAATLLVAAHNTPADIIVPGADGADAAFSPITNTVVDLSLATNGVWDTTLSNGKGVYDAAKWAIVFRYASVNIPTGVTVRFTNHPSRAPVVWLVSGNVTINGSLDFSGEQGGYDTRRHAEPGPGGSYGGVNNQGAGPRYSDGFGWGAGKIGSSVGGAGSFSTVGSGGGSILSANIGAAGVTYGNSQIGPLIGGSGGGGSGTTGGGGGGGAVLIAARKRIGINGSIAALGAKGYYNSNDQIGGSGSGGSIRLISESLNGAGLLDTRGQYNLSAWDYGRSSVASSGGNGRIRLECRYNTAQSLVTYPGASVVDSGPVAQLWPPTNAPTLRILSVGGATAPAASLGNINAAFNDLQVNAGATEQVILLESQNLATNAVVQLRVGPKYGSSFLVTAAYQAGDFTYSTWLARAVLPAELSILQARAVSGDAVGAP